MGRKKLPETRESITHKRPACGFELYVTVSFYGSEAPAQPGEVFVKVAKSGSEVAGLMAGVCIALSLALQYGMPWEEARKNFLGERFGNPDAHGNTSLLDALAKGVDVILEERVDELAERAPPEPPAPPAPRGPEGPEGPSPVPAIRPPSPPALPAVAAPEPIQEATA